MYNVKKLNNFTEFYCFVFLQICYGIFQIGEKHNITRKTGT